MPSQAVRLRRVDRVGAVAPAHQYPVCASEPKPEGLAVPGMPVGSPGMEEGSAEPYEVVMFGLAGRRTYMRFVGDRAL